MARKAVLFDLDGTLIDSRPGIFHCFRETLAVMGERVPSDEELVTVIGPPLSDGFSFFIKDKIRTAAAVEMYRAMYKAGAMFEAEVYSGILEALEELSSSNDLLCVTSKTREYAEQIVSHFGLNRFIRKVYGPEPDGLLANKKTLIGHVLKTEGIAIHNAVMIGDTFYDIDGARGNSIRSVGVLWGFGTREDLRDADAVIQVPDQLVSSIGRVFE
jgi:phosphoglycolate phosphatase